MVIFLIVFIHKHPFVYSEESNSTYYIETSTEVQSINDSTIFSTLETNHPSYSETKFELETSTSDQAETTEDTTVLEETTIAFESTILAETTETPTTLEPSNI